MSISESAAKAPTAPATGTSGSLMLRRHIRDGNYFRAAQPVHAADFNHAGGRCGSPYQYHLA